MTGILALTRPRRLGFLVALAFAALPVGSALAATTVGQIGPPEPNFGFAGGFEQVQTSAAVPAAGTVTSFSTQSGFCRSLQGSYNFQVLRPLGSNQYQVLGDTGNQNNPCDGAVHSYTVNITVHAGDVLGVYVVSDWEGYLGGNDPRGYAAIPEPAVNDIITVNPSTGTIDESATFVPALPTTVDQCLKGGWQTFGVFKNQGDCVSFVATAGQKQPTS